jgi:hypothetical protein
VKYDLPGVRRGTALLAVAAVSLAACLDVTGPQSLLDDPRLSTITSPFGRTFLEVTPMGPLELVVGDTVRFSSPQFPTADLAFSSSDPLLASVSPAGLLSALAPGEARVTISRQTSARASSTVVVRIASRGPSSVHLEGLTDSAGATVRTDSVAGTVFPRVRLERGDAARLEVLLGGEVACSQSLPFGYSPTSSPGAEPVPGSTSVADEGVTEAIGCGVDTAAFDANGNPAFRNGLAPLAVRLVRSDSAGLASSGVLEVRLRNRDAIHARVTGEIEAPDAEGRKWLGGALTVAALLVLYEPGVEIATLSFTYVSPDGRARVLPASEAPYSVVFTGSELRGVLDPALRIQVRSAGASGERGPETSTEAYRYDGVPPTAGTVRQRAWIGADVEFASLYTPPATPDAGVGRTTVRFVAGDANQSEEQIIASGRPVTVGADLQQSGPGAYRLAYQLCDAVMNCLWDLGFQFGVDLEPPRLRVSLPAQSINPAEDLRAEASDSESGVGESPIEVAVLARVPGGTVEVCGPSVEQVQLPGRLVGGVCQMEAIAGDLRIPRNTTGYFVYRLVAADRAGNRSPAAEVAVLVDHEAPTVRTFTLASSLVPGEETTIVAELADNLDLDALGVRWVFPAPGGRSLALPFATATRLGTPFSGVLTPTSTARPRLPVVRTLTYATPLGRSTVAVDSLQLRLTDAAGHASFASRPVPSAAFSGVAPSDPFSAVSSVAASATVQRVCTDQCTPGDAAAVGVTVRIIGEPGLSALSRMSLMAVGANGVVTEVASTQTFSVAETGTQRTYSYTFTYRPPVGVRGSYTLFGIGLSSGGNALKSPDLGVEFFTR